MAERDGTGKPMGTLGPADFGLLAKYAAVGAFAGFLTGKVRNVGIGAAIGVLVGGVFSFLETVGRDSEPAKKEG